MGKTHITQEQFDTAKAQAVVAVLGIRAMNDNELVMHLLELYLKGLKAGIGEGFTVIGYYDTGERYNGHHNGETWVESVQSAIAEAGMDLNIVEVIAGSHMGLTEGEHVEAACDFPTVGDDEKVNLAELN